MVLFPGFLVDQVVEQRLPRDKIVALGMYAAYIARKREHVGEIGFRIVAHVILGQFSRDPGAIERVVQQSRISDGFVQSSGKRHFVPPEVRCDSSDGREIVAHRGLADATPVSHFWSLPAAHAASPE